MYEITYRYTYPTTTIEPYVFPQEFYDHVQQHYVDNRIYQEKNFSEDGLVLTTRVVWVNQEAYDAYVSDPIISEALAGKKQYNIDNGITWTYETREISTL